LAARVSEVVKELQTQLSRIAQIQRMADQNIADYGLLEKR